VVAGCDRRLGDSDFRGKLLASLGKNRGACASAQEWMRRNSPLRRCVASHINCCFSNTLHKFLKVLSHDLPQRCGDHRGEPSPALRGIAGIAIAARLVLRDFSKARVYVVIIARQRCRDGSCAADKTADDLPHCPSCQDRKTPKISYTSEWFDLGARYRRSSHH
jgi:hypothetical protein